MDPEHPQWASSQVHPLPVILRTIAGIAQAVTSLLIDMILPQDTEAQEALPLTLIKMNITTTEIHIIEGVRKNTITEAMVRRNIITEAMVRRNTITEVGVRTG